MIPSSKFNFETIKTNGFTYKQTTQTVGEIFPYRSNLDVSIAYTLPRMESYRTMIPTFINLQPPQREYITGNYFRMHYPHIEGGEDDRWSTVGAVHGVSDSSLDCVIYWAFVNDFYPTYYFNGNDGRSTIGDNTFKFISGFDVSHMIFNADIIGYTKAQFEDYKTDGSDQTEQSITLQEIIEHPDDYVISRFSVGSSAYWDSDEEIWRMFAPVKLACLVNGGNRIQGISSSSTLLFGDQSTASIKQIGINRMGAYHLYSPTENYRITDSTIYRRIGGIPVGLNTNNPYSLGQFTDDWFWQPKWNQLEMIEYINAQVFSSTDNTNNPNFTLSTGHGEVWGYDKFNVSNNFNGADQRGEFHYSKWDKILTAVGYADKLSEFLASAGCYFHIGAVNNNYNNILNERGVTPDTLYRQTDIALGHMHNDGTTSGTWIVGEDIEDYHGINRRGDVIHPSFNPDIDPTPTSQEGYHMKVILSDYAEKIKFKTPKRRTQI